MRLILCTVSKISLFVYKSETDLEMISSRPLIRIQHKTVTTVVICFVGDICRIVQSVDPVDVFPVAERSLKVIIFEKYACILTYFFHTRVLELWLTCVPYDL